MTTTLYPTSSNELTESEQAVLRHGGVNLDHSTTRDLVAETAVKYAALIESGLSTKDVATQLAIPESQVRQMISRKTLYSILLNNRRYIPFFQFENTRTLVPNISKVNVALPSDLHPVEVYQWYTEADLELFLADDIDTIRSPLAWLRSGGDTKKLVTLLHRL
ncbi:hypothetical protein N9850_12560 [Granulosicoccus sp.]|nr:hypothetical protein [Granulosicoccus sp.]MDB4224596.1 hypothetical protein [Granulosicoccus sp.]